MRVSICAAILLLGAVACGKPAADGGEEKETDKPQEETPIDLSRYTIVYSAAAEEEEGTALAAIVRDAVKSKTGKTLPVSSDEAAEKENEILVGKTNRSASKGYYSATRGIFDYHLSAKAGKILVAGGGCWAMEKAAGLLKTSPVTEGMMTEGSVYGKQLFPREEGSNLRILDDNVWQYNSTTNPPAWVAAGADCTNAVRSVGFAGLFLAYMPDVICLQEYSKNMHGFLGPRLETKGYKLAYTPAGSDWNLTPILYNTSTLTLEKAQFLRYTPAEFCDGTPGSKSYTAAVFTLKSNGKKFAVISTHLWWKSESAQAGSNAAREAQARKVMDAAEEIRSSFNCPVFVTGDMNCTLQAAAMTQMLNAGFKPLFDVATVYGDKRNGYHSCSKDGFSRASNKADNGYGCIDQFFIWNGGDTEIKTFWRIEPYFTVELTDHYPNYADIVIQ